MKNRSSIAVILLSLVTLGIYQLLWLKDTRKELVASGQSVPPVSVLLAPIIALLVVATLQFASQFARVSTSDGYANPSPASHITNILSVLIGMAVVVVIIPLVVYWFYRYCRAVEGMSGGRIEFSFSFITFIGLSFFSLNWIWPGLMQNAFNKLPAVNPTDLTPRAPFPPSIQSI